MPSVAFDRRWLASDFEWKYRAWILTALYLVALACFRFDRRDIGFSVAALMATPVIGRMAYLMAALLVFSAAFLRTWSYAYPPFTAAAPLFVANGPYRFVRHPLLLGSILLFLGFGLLLNWLGFALLVAGMAVLFSRLLRREEAMRSAGGGEDYAAYRATVPSLLPALQPHWPAGSEAPDWHSSFLREAYMWAFGVTLVTLAVTLREDVFYVALASSLLIQAVCFFLRKHQTTTLA